MSTNVPTTEWRATNGNGEFGTTDESLITLSGLQLITLNSFDLIALSGSYSPTPATDWTPDDLPPANIWQPTDGLSDFGYEGVYDIDDPSGVFLVDTAGNNIVDTGVTQTDIPASNWIEDDSV